MSAVQVEHIRRKQAQLEFLGKRFAEFLAEFNEVAADLIDGNRANDEIKQAAAQFTARVKGRDVVEYVANKFDMEAYRLTSTSRDRKVVMARQVAQYVLRTALDHTYPQIAKETGVENHATVIHSIRKVDALRKANEVFDRRIRGILEACMGSKRLPLESENATQ